MNNILILYSTKYGCSEKCAIELSKELTGKVDLVNLMENNKINLTKYDIVILGGSIYIGRIQKELTNFIKQNTNELMKKEIGLFICCMMDGEGIEKQITENFPSELLNKAKSVESFGGEFKFSKMNFMEKTIVKKIVKVTSDKSDIRYENIKRMAMKLNK